MSGDQFGTSRQKVLMLTGQPQDMEPFLALMPDVALMPVQDVLHDKSALRERVADSFMASQCDVIIIDSRHAIDLATLCRAIREYPSGKESHVLVMTHSEQDWATCMGLNVDDVVRVKPNEPVMASLATVMARYMRALTQRQLLEEKSQQAQSAIEAAAEYGSLLHVMEAAEKQLDLNGLAQLVVRHLAQKSLDAIIEINAPEGRIRSPEAGAPASHYAIITKLAAAETRTVELDRLLGYRYGVITLLVTNAPHKDPGKFGNLKDSLAHLCAIVEARARSIIIKQSINTQHAQMLEVMEVIRGASKGFHEYTHRVMVELGQELELAASTFDMPAEDESKLLTIANTARDKLDAVHENREMIESHFLELIAAMGSLKTLIDPPDQQQETPDADSVELF